MNREYLPSKLFMIRVAVVVIVVAIFFGISKLSHYLKNRQISPKEPGKVLVKDVVQKDSNNNGIPDWEEYLWGLDPNKNGSENKEFILSKKKSLTESGIITKSDDSQVLSDNDLLSQQFFATIISLQQTGQLDEESMSSVAEAIGKNVESESKPDVYDSKMLKTVEDSTVSKSIYHDDLAKLVSKYTDADIGSELTLIIQGLSNNDPSALYAAKTVADAYKSFGKDMMELKVPRSIASIQLSASNNYEKTGESIIDLVQMLSDPILGMKAVTSYRNYNDALASDLEKISDILQ